jgi:hypothetical protein
MEVKLESKVFFQKKTPPFYVLIVNLFIFFPHAANSDILNSSVKPSTTSIAYNYGLNITLSISHSLVELKSIVAIESNKQTTSVQNKLRKKERFEQIKMSSIIPGKLLIIAKDSTDNDLFYKLINDPGFVRAEVFSINTGEHEYSKNFYRELVSLSLIINNEQNLASLSIYRPDLADSNYKLRLIEKLDLTTYLENISPPPSTLFPEAVSVTTIINNGLSSNRVDIAILGDGYTVDELDNYAHDVSTLMDSYFNIEPYRAYQNFFNVHRIDVISNESGIDHPENSLYKDTAFDGEFNCSNIQRLVCVNTSKAIDIASDMLGDEGHDIILVIVNDDEYGGSGGSVAVISKNTYTVDLALHEIGHSFGLLADEYDYNSELCSLSEPGEPNSTTVTERDLVKWGYWIDSTVPLPTDISYGTTPGLYEGSRYCSTGMYRPTDNSMMRSLARPFDKINEEALIKRIYNYVEPVDSFSPAILPIEIQNSQLFSINIPPLQNNTIIANWYLNDKFVSSDISYNLLSTNLIQGSNKLTVEVVDNTDSVRADPNNILKKNISWNNITKGIQTKPTTPSEVDLSPLEGDSNHTTYFLLQIGSPMIIDVSVDYTTEDNTAIAGNDYELISGTATIMAGETQTAIGVEIIGDTIAESDESFKLIITNPQGANFPAGVTEISARKTIVNDD